MSILKLAYIIFNFSLLFTRSWVLVRRRPFSALRLLPLFLQNHSLFMPLVVLFHFFEFGQGLDRGFGRSRPLAAFRLLGRFERLLGIHKANSFRKSHLFIKFSLFGVPVFSADIRPETAALLIFHALLHFSIFFVSMGNIALITVFESLLEPVYVSLRSCILNLTLVLWLYMSVFTTFILIVDLLELRLSKLLQAHKLMNILFLEKIWQRHRLILANFPFIVPTAIFFLSTL